jgi:hypothetical protein
VDLQAYDKKKASEAKARKAAKEAEAARTAELELLYKGAPRKDDTEKSAKQVGWPNASLSLGVPCVRSWSVVAARTCHAKRRILK